MQARLHSQKDVRFENSSSQLARDLPVYILMVFYQEDICKIDTYQILIYTYRFYEELLHSAFVHKKKYELRYMLDPYY